MKQLIGRTLLDDLKDFASFLKSNACVWGSRIDNGETKSLLITDTELENAIKQYLWEKLRHDYDLWTRESKSACYGDKHADNAKSRNGR